LWWCSAEGFTLLERFLYILFFKHKKTSIPLKKNPKVLQKYFSIQILLKNTNIKNTLLVIY